MGMANKELFENQIVDVDTPSGADTHSGPFVGTIVSIQEDTVTVRDQNGVDFSVNKSRVTPVEN
jgi:NAD(P)H-hydrate repair Nnr-like enzyme with NAD(P)H-hydrate epimerase domain